MTEVWLALSGGGLRSCSFGAGALLEEALTPKIISTVSGGGYAGASFVVSQLRALENRDEKEMFARREIGLGFLNFLVFFSVIGLVLFATLYSGGGTGNAVNVRF